MSEEQAVKAQSTILDPADVREAILEGMAGIERGNFIELKGGAELKEFFDDIVKRGKKRAAGQEAESPALVVLRHGDC